MCVHYCSATLPNRVEVASICVASLFVARRLEPTTYNQSNRAAVTARQNLHSTTRQGPSIHSVSCLDRQRAKIPTLRRSLSMEQQSPMLLPTWKQNGAGSPPRALRPRQLERGLQVPAVWAAGSGHQKKTPPKRRSGSSERSLALDQQNSTALPIVALRSRHGCRRARLRRGSRCSELATPNSMSIQFNLGHVIPCPYREVQQH